MTLTTSPRPEVRSATRFRRGVTLIEMMVVVGIIAILLAITGVALQKATEGQRNRTSREQCYKLQQSLDIEYERAVKGCARDQTDKHINSKIVEYCEDDTNRALAVWTAMKLRQQFPESFAEALSPIYITQDVATGTVLALRVGSYNNTTEVPVYTLQPHATFEAVRGLSGGQQNEQSGALLYIILTRKSLGGAEAMAVSGDDLGAKRKVSFGNIQLDTFQDAWNNSVGFRRWFGTNPGEDEVQQPEYYGSVNQFNANNKDVIDNRNLVLGWNNTTKAAQLAALGFNGRNRMPTVYSLGKLDTDPSDDLMGFRLRRFGATGATAP